MSDCGGIKVMGPSGLGINGNNAIEISGNFISGATIGSACLYADGTNTPQNLPFRVDFNGNACIRSSTGAWVFVLGVEGSQSGSTVRNNWYSDNTTASANWSTGMTQSNNTSFTAGSTPWPNPSWPTAAQDIYNQAGVPSGHQVGP